MPAPPRPPANHPVPPGPPPNPILHAARQAGAAAAQLPPQDKAALAKAAKAIAEKHKAALDEAKERHRRHELAAKEAERLLEEAQRRAVTPEEKAALEAHRRRAKEARERLALANRHVAALEAQHSRVSAAMEGISAEQAVAIRTNAGPACSAIASELHWVRVLLENADHDYDGHRAAAVQQITGAIKILAPRAKYGDKDTGGNPWPQSKSDQMLGQALSVLANDAAFTHHLPATTKTRQVFGHITTAIKELEIALAIR
jgi:hypothetical protein